MESQDTDAARYIVLVNGEEQYSLWREGKTVPAGWTAVDVRGDKQTCLAFIESVWTDMRPASLRASMAADGQAG